MSPRISFSGDVPSPADQQNVGISSSSSSIEFDFCVFRESFDYESSSADELFLDGKILPIEIKRRMDPLKKVSPPPPKQPPLPSPPPPPPPLQDEIKPLKPRRFRRSSSLSCGSVALCPLPLLSRSNSTGSSSPITKPQYKKFSSSSSSSASNPSNKQSQYMLSSSHHHHQHHYQKPPLKKFMSSSGIRINPVLNITPASLFCLTSIFSGGKDKSKKK